MYVYWALSAELVPVSVAHMCPVPFVAGFDFSIEAGKAYLEEASHRVIGVYYSDFEEGYYSRGLQIDAMILHTSHTSPRTFRWAPLATAVARLDWAGILGPVSPHAPAHVPSPDELELCIGPADDRRVRWELRGVLSMHAEGLCCGHPGSR
jgi:hypothetical protein